MLKDKHIRSPSVIYAKSTAMENLNQDQFTEEEIPNLDQFQVGRSASSDDELSPTAQNQEDDLGGGDDDDAGYTEGEVEYADGEGTMLDDETEDFEDEDDDMNLDTDDDADFENPDDDPA